MNGDKNGITIDRFDLYGQQFKLTGAQSLLLQCRPRANFPPY